MVELSNYKAGVIVLEAKISLKYYASIILNVSKKWKRISSSEDVFKIKISKFTSFISSF